MAATPWKEHTAPDGRKYYYNKETKESRWTMPDELKKASSGDSSATSVASGVRMDKSMFYQWMGMRACPRALL